MMTGKEFRGYSREQVLKAAKSALTFLSRDFASKGGEVRDAMRVERVVYVDCKIGCPPVRSTRIITWERLEKLLQEEEVAE